MCYIQFVIVMINMFYLKKKKKKFKYREGRKIERVKTHKLTKISLDFSNWFLYLSASVSKCDLYSELNFMVSFFRSLRTVMINS